MDDLFKEQEVDPLLQTIDQTKNYLEELVGEGKKFKDYEGLAKGKAESDFHILRLQNELKGLREELAQRQKVSELLDKLNSNPPSRQPVTQREEPDTIERQMTQDVNIDELINKALNTREQVNTQKSNMDFVREQLIKAHGDNYQQVLKQKIDALGMTKEQFMTVVSNTPKAALALVDVKRETPSPLTPPRSQVQSTSLRPVNTGDRNKAYYDDLKKRDASTYWSPRVQSQMHKDALSMGESFFG